MHNHHHSFAEHAHASADTARLMKLAGKVSVTVAIILVIIKVVAWSLTDSLSLFSSLVDSLLDVISSLINYFAIRYALMPPDDDHRFGHGKAEDIAGLAQSMFIAGSGLFIFFEGVRRLFIPAVITHSGVGLWVMAVSLIFTSALVLFQRYVIRKTNSIAVTADSLHYLTDILSNAGVILALVLTTQLGWKAADPLIAFVIAAYIFYNAWKIGFTAFHNLMDREFDDADRKKILEIVHAHPEVRGVHELKTRKSGIYSFIQMHVMLDADMQLSKAHTISEDIENKIMALIPHSDVIIHEDPAE